MDKDELIAFKNQLLSNKKYGQYLASDEHITSKVVATKEQILKEVDTKEAIEFLEKTIEKIVEYLCVREIDFDGIEMYGNASLFVSSHF